MFGSGDDKKSKQTADNAESISPEVQQESAVQEKPAKKGLFSWFGRKKNQPKVESPAATVAEQAPLDSIEEPVASAVTLIPFT